MLGNPIHSPITLSRIHITKRIIMAFSRPPIAPLLSSMPAADARLPPARRGATQPPPAAAAENHKRGERWKTQEKHTFVFLKRG
jgi:hypothetical protein